MPANTVVTHRLKTAEDLKKQELEQVTQCGMSAIQLIEITDYFIMSQFMLFARLFW